VPRQKDPRRKKKRGNGRSNRCERHVSAPTTRFSLDAAPMTAPTIFLYLSAKVEHNRTGSLPGDVLKATLGKSRLCCWIETGCCFYITRQCKPNNLGRRPLPGGCNSTDLSRTNEPRWTSETGPAYPAVQFIHDYYVRL
jgi:hypothetical protein